MATNLRFIVEHDLMDIYKKNCVTEDYVMNHINPLLPDDFDYITEYQHQEAFRNIKRYIC